MDSASADGLKNAMIVKRNTINWRKREWKYPIGKGFDAKVKQGDKVRAGQMVAVGKVPAEYNDFDISKELGKWKASWTDKFGERLGEVVEAGDSIGRFGLKNVVAPISGVLTGKRINKGIVRIVGELTEEEVSSVLSGVVTKNTKEFLVVESESQVMNGFLGCGKEVVTGEWKYIEDIHRAARNEVEGRIVWGKSSLLPQEIDKLIAIGAECVVCPTIVLEDGKIEMLLEKNMTWISLFGFGRCQLPKGLFESMNRYQNIKVIVNTQMCEIGFPEDPGNKAKKRRESDVLDLVPAEEGLNVAHFGTNQLTFGQVTKVDSELGIAEVEVGKTIQKFPLYELVCV